MKYVCAIFLGMILCCQMGMAGEIRGKLQSFSSTSASPAVVWVEGVKQFTVPTRNPVMAQRKGEFNPAFLVVVAGQTVEMPNEDLVAHNVYSDSTAKTFDLGFYAQGEHKEVTFERPGVVDMGCRLHNFMHAKILVVPNPYFAQVNPDGSFEIHDLPAGRYQLKLWNDGERELVRGVIVPAQGTASINVK